MSVEQSDKSNKCLATSKIIEATIAVKVYDNLIAELRCPSCAYPMKAPIKLCENGHATCHLCFKMLAKCPLCLKPFTEIRALTLEAMSAKAQFKCTNSTLGCPVRLQLNLLGKHEEQCVYQLGHCFMGKVWENCKWHGREMDWIDHCELDHREKVFFGAEVTRTWELKRSLPTICAFFIFRVFNETFNFYQIYDNHRNKLCWTMVCASKNPNAAKRYSFEIELFSPSDETKIAVQRNPCHSNSDAGILQKSAVFGLGEIMGFMDESRIIHYRVKVMENHRSKRMSTTNISSEARSRSFENNFSQTNIEGSNIKKIPSEKIITRRTNKTVCSNASLTDSSLTLPKDNSLLSKKESSSKNFPLGGLKIMLSNSSKPIESGNRKHISNLSPSQSEHCRIKSQIEPMKTSLLGDIIKTDSIDETIIENNDLKKIFIRSYNIDVKNIDDFLKDREMSLSNVNSIPKPPRISLEIGTGNNHDLSLNDDIVNEMSPHTGVRI